MYLHLGYSAVVSYGDIIGIFDADHVSSSRRTRPFLEREEREGNLEMLGERLPGAMVVCDSGTYLTPISAPTLQKHLAENEFTA